MIVALLVGLLNIRLRAFFYSVYFHSNSSFKISNKVRANIISVLSISIPMGRILTYHFITCSRCIHLNIIRHSFLCIRFMPLANVMVKNLQLNTLKPTKDELLMKLSVEYQDGYQNGFLKKSNHPTPFESNNCLKEKNMTIKHN